MALIVAPQAGAESYISVADADAYHAARGNVSWAAFSVANKEIFLRRATDYMQAHYHDLWKGVPISPEQPLDWPRYSAVVNGWLLDSGTIPAAIKAATSVLALKASTGDLYPHTTDLTGSAAEIEQAKVGPIEVKYARSVSLTSGARFPYVDELLSRYTIGSSRQTRLVRG